MSESSDNNKVSLEFLASQQKLLLERIGDFAASFTAFREDITARVGNVENRLLHLEIGQAALSTDLKIVKETVTSTDKQLVIAGERLHSIELRTYPVEERLGGIEKRLAVVDNRLTRIEEHTGLVKPEGSLLFSTHDR